MPQGPSVVDRLDGVNEGIGVKAPVRVATTANITLSGEQTIDGIACVELDRVLVKNQTNAVLNGFYNVSTGTWERTLDCNGNRDLVMGSRVLVNEGATNGQTRWFVTSANPIIIDSSTITWVQEIGAGGDDEDPPAIGGIDYVFDGGGSAITVSKFGDLIIPFGFEITGASIVLDADSAAGSFIVDVRACSYALFETSVHPVIGDSITAAAPLTVTTGTDKATSVLTGWTTTFDADTVLRFIVTTANSAVTQATVCLEVEKAGGSEGTPGITIADAYPPGFLMFQFSASALPGGTDEWVRANALTIGNAASVATERANAEEERRVG